jgi:hypothetical protein
MRGCAVLLASVVLGCGRPARSESPRPGATAAPADAARPLADDLPRLAARAHELFRDWHVAFADPDLPCATAAARMNELADRNADVIAANLEVVRAGPERIAALRAELAKLDAANEAFARAIVESPIMARCVTEPAFSRAVDRLAGES